LSGRVGCMKFDKSRAARALKESGFNGKLEMGFSRMGGDDIARGAEWFQGQWKRHLGLTVELQSEEQAVYLRQLKVKPPAIFRKGVSLDRPTCLAGLEVFTKGNPENYIRFEDAKYEELVNELRRAKGEGKRRIACRKAVEHLLFTRRLIPLGEMYFTILVDPLYTGWDLNELNQLDLSRLQRKL
ncbi:MAG TPA: peptide ABC transporter substrate-binding protein, partial [Bdellovibrionales bacterium]|nr:peptide ABC transporter substrate-binding protein [Bdellovibrionales bacterium]